MLDLFMGVIDSCTAVGAWGKTISGFFGYILKDLVDKQVQIADIVQLKDTYGLYDNGYLKSITTTLETYATIICGVMFMIEFIKLTIKVEGVKIEYVLSVAFKFVLARAALSIGWQFIEAFMATANELTGVAVGVSFSHASLPAGVAGPTIPPALDFGSVVEKLQKDVKEACENVGFFEGIGLLVQMLIPFMAVKVIGFVGVVMAYGRVFEIAMYRLMYPIPCALLLLDHGRVPKRFLASVCACALQGPIMIISTKFFQAMVVGTCASLDKTNADYVKEVAFSMLMASMVMLMGMMKSGQWANKIVGEG